MPLSVNPALEFLFCFELCSEYRVEFCVELLTIAFSFFLGARKGIIQSTERIMQRLVRSSDLLTVKLRRIDKTAADDNQVTDGRFISSNGLGVLRLYFRSVS